MTKKTNPNEDKIQESVFFSYITTHIEIEIRQKTS